VNELFVGRENTENHKWLSVNFFLTDWVNKCLNVVKSFLHATGKTRSINPSSFSTANQLLHTKLDLKNQLILYFL
jgi:hypothetical protein